MIEAIKSVLRQAASARRSGESAEAERLYKEAAAEAKAKDDATRAEALMGSAQMRRDAGDRVSAAICYAEAITLLRQANDTCLLAHALRHAADVRSELHEFAVAASHIDEAVRLYRALSISDDPPPTLDLANALRVSALNNERAARAAWNEARELYRSVAGGESAEDAGCAGIVDASRLSGSDGGGARMRHLLQQRSCSAAEAVLLRQRGWLGVRQEADPFASLRDDTVIEQTYLFAPDIEVTL